MGGILKANCCFPKPELKLLPEILRHKAHVIKLDKSVHETLRTAAGTEGLGVPGDGAGWGELWIPKGSGGGWGYLERGCRGLWIA